MACPQAANHSDGGGLCGVSSCWAMLSATLSKCCRRGTSRPATRASRSSCDLPRAEYRATGRGVAADMFAAAQKNRKDRAARIRPRD